MITKIAAQLDLNKELRTTNIGSLLHGVLMEILPNDIVESIHSKASYSPLKQRIIFNGDNSEWEIVLLDESLVPAIAAYFATNHSFILKKHSETVNIKQYTVTKYEVNDLIKKYFSETVGHREYITINIKTPMSFKSNGQYDIFPDLKKYFRSIMLTTDTFFSEYHMHDHETLDYIEQNVKIVNYKLRSTKFHLEGIKIPAFIGQMTIQVKGAATFVQLINLLLAIGEETGVGIKTSLGMGKYTIEK